MRTCSMLRGALLTAVEGCVAAGASKVGVVYLVSHFGA